MTTANSEGRNPLRRSSRARSTPKNDYDQVLDDMAYRKLKQQKKNDDSDEDSEIDSEDDIVDDSSIDDKDYEGSKTQNNKKKTTTKKRKIVGQSASKMSNNVKRTTKGKRNVHAALQTLSRKILKKEETPSNSLIAALMASAKPISSIASVPTTTTTSSKKSSSVYTPQLQGIAKKVWNDFAGDSNELHIQVLNLLFQSVGGSSLLEKETNLEDLDDEDWDTFVSSIVDEMSSADVRLLEAVNPTDRLGFLAFSEIYEEFWYRLGMVLLTHTSSAFTMTNKDSDDKPQPFSSNRFQVEVVRDLILRLMELVSVGQPDLRYAATVAIWQLSSACVERTCQLYEKEQIITRQSKAIQKNSQMRKLQSLQENLTQWKRHKAELEEIVLGSVFQGVFIHRYRDTNPKIRISSMEWLSTLTVKRPDLFLENKFLKYFGWLASDKEPQVRLAAVQALLEPFLEAKKQTTKTLIPIQIQDLQSVCFKFLPRIVDCIEDSQSLHVQELAMSLLLNLEKNEFLDEWDDDNGWDQINLKALDMKTSPKVRKDALYFVLDQMDSFDTVGSENEDANDARSSISYHGAGEKKIVERLESISSWIANKLCDGTNDINLLRVDLTDCVVQSLTDMPEHKHLTVSWSSLLTAIRGSDKQKYSSQQQKGREESVKQRVLLRMLACGAKLELASQEESNKKRKRPSQDNSNHPQEALSLALLKNLAQLFTAFQGDVVALRSITTLPQYLIPSVFSLPARKAEFLSTVKIMTKLFLESTDTIVLQNVAHSLLTLVEGGHIRVPDVKIQLLRMSLNLQDRLMELLRQSDPFHQKSSPMKSQNDIPGSHGTRRSTRRSDTSTTSTLSTIVSPEVDMENSIALLLLRWRILLKKCPLSFLFQEMSPEDDDDDEEGDPVEGFCNTLSEAIAKRLLDRKPREEDDDENMEDASMTQKSVATIWKSSDKNIHSVVAKAVDGALQVLLCALSWKLYETFRQKEGDKIDDGQETVILRLRDRLVSLLGLAFDQYIESEYWQGSDEQLEFSKVVGSSAARVASDLRTLFPREWALAKDATRKKLALTADSQLIGGSARILSERRKELLAQSKANDDEDEDKRQARKLVEDLLLPLARSLTANWKDGNRKEAGIVLSYITAHGKPASQTVQSLARQLKKINSVRFLEAQMGSLRMSFNAWLDSEPEELPTKPSQSQLEQFEFDEQEHQQLFEAAAKQAAQLSKSLGVGKLSDPKLSKALGSFMEEGIRFAFDDNSDEELLLGSRLPFLLILQKYSVWAKKNRTQLTSLQQRLVEKEGILQSHPNFEEVHPDDLNALQKFKESLGMKILTAPKRADVVPNDEDSSTEADHPTATPSPDGSLSVASSSRRRISTASSQRSRMSTQSNLSPLYEEDDGEDSTSPLKKRRLSSQSTATKSKIDEEGEYDSVSISP